VLLETSNELFLRCNNIHITITRQQNITKNITRWRRGWYWQCGSVVTTSVFGWQTFHDLCLIYGWHATIS